MPHLHKLQIFQEEWNPSFIKTSFDWPALNSADVADDGSVEYLGRSPSTGWGISVTLSRVAKPPPTKGKGRAASISVWELAESRFHPCANRMGRSCEGIMVAVEASFTSESSNDPEAVLLDVPCKVPTGMSRFIITVTITSSPNSRSFFDILEDVKTQLSRLNWEHDQTCIQRERAGVRALQQSLKSGIFFDTRLLAYSRRSTRGHVMAPSSLYANTSVLAAKSQKFDFSGSDLTDAMGSLFIRDPEDQSSGPPLILEDYEYESDSDLDDDEILLGPSQAAAPASGEMPSATQREASGEQGAMIATPAENDARDADASGSDTDHTSLSSFSVVGGTLLFDRSIVPLTERYKAWRTMAPPR
ncbi:hypothetical protein BU15DRAFT_84245 [Melanogaster broomeanus]|nr:hypothetical protein BU15DRAFT_84245 [Melanogaster broomeanus]